MHDAHRQPTLSMHNVNAHRERTLRIAMEITSYFASFRMRNNRLLLCLLIFSYYRANRAYEICSTDTGNGICPTGNTCCPIIYSGSHASGCISDDMGEHHATCCDDGKTGCAVGYTCRSGNPNDCLLDNYQPTIPISNSDPVVRVMPRYQLCHAPEIAHLHALPLNTSTNTATTPQDVVYLGYYSSHGPIELIPPQTALQIPTALIVLHGANRNADDYFCAASAAVSLQTRYPHVLLLAPHFPSARDARPSDDYLRWDDGDENGPWRYGADSVGPVAMSSFAALDSLVEAVSGALPDLERVVIAGHSSGGQMVQRWSLLTDVWVGEGGGRMEAVVANPSSYVYLSPDRLIGGEWMVPKEGECPGYDGWEWGLEDGGNRTAPYRDRAFGTDDKKNAVVERFRTRKLTYLAGGSDRCNVSAALLDSGSSPWCNSHGLETTCGDMLQGLQRLERSAWYMESLRRMGFERYHKRVLVEGVGHDHALMFQSREGLETLFGLEGAAQAESLWATID